jgi:multiple sugar transport system substrate-binding protein/sn-glycerol 3-phosphate transport system substrate-binding protein
MGSTGDVLSAVSAGIVSGELPNISIAFQDVAMGWYLDNAVTPLDAFMDDPNWGFGDMQADLNRDIIEINRIPGDPFDDQLLLWPVGGSANVISVNLDMLAELGFDSPATNFDDFRAIACGAAELTGPAGEDVQGFPIRADGFDLESWVAAQGSDIYDGMQYTFTNDAVITVLTFFQELYNDGCAYAPESAFSNTADFANGLNPMAQGSTAGVPFINGDIEESGVPKTWVNTVVPYAENPTLQVFLRSLVIIPSTPEQELASWLFLKHLAETNSQVLWTEMTRYLPYTVSGQDGLSMEFLDSNPQFNNLLELLAQDDLVIYAVPRLVSHGDAASLLSELVAAVTTGGEDPMEAAARFEEEANELLEDM